VNGQIRVLVVDDDVPTRIGLRTIFETEPDIEVVAEAADGNEACLLADALAPDVVLMDVRLPHLDGISATSQIVEAGSADPGRTRIVVLTTFDDATIVCRALEAGASAVLLKRVPAEELVASVRAVAALPADQPPSIISAARPAGDGADRPTHAELIARLTERERQVLVLMAQGRSNREVARLLTISNETVKTHVKRIFMKLDIHDRALAIVAAYESGLVKPGTDRQRAAAPFMDGTGLEAGTSDAFSPPAPPFSPFPR
jgi:DNA-binding NarL/FixJ family response regulator